VEIGSSEVYVVVQVESSPSFAGDSVNIDSSQLQAACVELDFYDLVGTNNVRDFGSSASVVLDNDGNASVLAIGFDCAPGSSVIEADLESAPFATALGTLVAQPPAVTTPGVFGSPTTSGVVTSGVVETGDTAASGDSDLYAVFDVETSPVYAEQNLEISSAQLEDRCITGWTWISGEGGPTRGATTSTDIIDDDGNAVFAFLGSSCAAGTSTLIADVLAGFNTTYTGNFTVNPPEPTI
jgi:hypothetical protein